VNLLEINISQLGNLDLIKKIGIVQNIEKTYNLH
jgi:hypothetical protein